MLRIWVPFAGAPVPVTSTLGFLCSQQTHLAIEILTIF